MRFILSKKGAVDGTGSLGAYRYSLKQWNQDTPPARSSMLPVAILNRGIACDGLIGSTLYGTVPKVLTVIVVGMCCMCTKSSKPWLNSNPPSNTPKHAVARRSFSVSIVRSKIRTFLIGTKVLIQWTISRKRIPTMVICPVVMIVIFVCCMVMSREGMSSI